ncbi:MAG TPA: SDR family oxidoreductase [Cellvibrionaceae bacterium]|nr:SDR family oxidoreductase [Cellvibrionaceae bacterium]HMW71590.1 SDR family oxidoreductase [Cellvibrionaceae bacterium]HMY39336.1 SDR family oxidoreductase [Marinagarivorans sp.]HNG60055.1 SDR family oxidoreductase [Cellvibrionaceae bacterium]
MQLADSTILITGGSRGLGLGIVEALVAEGAQVSVVARDTTQLEQIAARVPIDTFSADVTDPLAAAKILSAVAPDVIILNAGAPPKMASLTDISWEEFSHTWDIDVKAGLYWLQAILKNNPAKAQRILVVSSGAAINGSPASGGYAGAKRMLWLMAQYAQGIAEQQHLNKHFQVIVPQQMVLGTGIGDAGARAYAKAAKISPEEFVLRFGAPMAPRDYGDKVAQLLTDERFTQGFAFGISGEDGIRILQPSE